MKRDANMTRGKIASKVLVLLLLCLLFVLPETANGVEQKQITVVFRYDDYSSLSSTDIEVKLIKAFQKYKVPCTFGVIPCVYAGDVRDPAPQNVVPLTPLKAGILKDAIEAHVLEAALHGYSHQTIRTQAEGQHTEFSGLDYSSQKQRIADGKTLLEEMLGIRVTTFIPPWDTYDLNTIRALEELGFKTISAGTAGVTKDPSRLRFLPRTGGLLDLQDAVRVARKSRDVQPIIVALFHEYDFREIDRGRGNFTYQDFVELLRWVTSQEDIRVRTIDEATKVIGDLDSHRFKIYSNFLSSPPGSISPPFLVPRLNYYPSPTTVHGMKVRAWLFSTFFYLVALATSITAAFLIGRLIFSRLIMLGVAAKYGSLLLLVLCSIYILHDLGIYYKGATALICLLGMCVGIWGSFHQVQKRKSPKVN